MQKRGSSRGTLKAGLDSQRESSDDSIAKDTQGSPQERVIHCVQQNKEVKMEDDSKETFRFGRRQFIGKFCEGTFINGEQGAQPRLEEIKNRVGGEKAEVLGLSSM